jgi:hypothetical protein
VCLQAATAAAQAGNQLLGAARIDLQVFGDLLDVLVGADRALTGVDFACYQFFCKRQAAGLSACATVGSRQ